jgi:hypothetical protein
MTEDSSQTAMAKSQNKHNRLSGTAGPLHEALPDLIESEEISETQDPKVRGKRLV